MPGLFVWVRGLSRQTLATSDSEKRIWRQDAGGGMQNRIGRLKEVDCQMGVQK